jgi:hypothetical protein
VRNLGTKARLALIVLCVLMGMRYVTHGLLCDAFVTVTRLSVHCGASFLALDKNSPSMLHGKEE